MIKVENLVKMYGGHAAVDDLSFEVEKGQIYGFLGPNGAGKTTTMNIMTGYLAPTEGKVMINSYDMATQAEAAKKCIGYLPEIPPLYPDMTVYEYLRFVSELKKVPKDEREEQIREIMQMVEIMDVRSRLIRNLSKGYKQRVGLAQAIIGYPEVIILDEPMVGLDPRQIMETRSVIKKLAQKQHTIILSSHILSEISTLCDHIMIIAYGRLAASDSPEGLQKLMVKTTEIEVCALGSREKAEEILAAVKHIHSYTFEEPSEEESIRIRIVTDDDTDIRGEISVALTNGNMPVLSMQKKEKSLEDIFLQLTQYEEEEEVEADDGDL
ncbi:MAG: ABC transporter ATP-binding protein [Roseburia sp.]|nr:ABC transporter ATP-binding protein [Ruminococcus sp.]MCM1154613.1 ABC transporter ATP-binding protein [Roseburia sp.]MCM1241698.1 ABC transporter ATP-binding protein [Roseburia sp.]